MKIFEKRGQDKVKKFLKITFKSAIFKNTFPKSKSRNNLRIVPTFFKKYFLKSSF